MLRSASRNFPIDLEPDLRAAAYSVSSLAGLPEYIASPARNQAQIILIEIGSLAELDRAVLLVDWTEHVQPFAPARYLLLLASKNLSLGDRSVKLAAAETVVLPQPARNILFKIELQSRLLQTAPPPSAGAAEGFVGRVEELVTPAGRKRVLAVRGQRPKQGSWQDSGNVPSGKVRWRWVSATGGARPPSENGFDWSAESHGAPRFDEKSEAWLLEGEGDDLVCRHAGEVLFSALGAAAATDSGYSSGRPVDSLATSVVVPPDGSVSLPLLQVDGMARKENPEETRVEGGAEDGLGKGISSLDLAGLLPKEKKTPGETASADLPALASARGEEGPGSGEPVPSRAAERVARASDKVKAALAKANAALAAAERASKREGPSREADEAPAPAPAETRAPTEAQRPGPVRVTSAIAEPPPSLKSAPAKTARIEAEEAHSSEETAPGAFFPEASWNVRPGSGGTAEEEDRGREGEAVPSLAPRARATGAGSLEAPRAAEPSAEPAPESPSAPPSTKGKTPETVPGDAPIAEPSLSEAPAAGRAERTSEKPAAETTQAEPTKLAARESHPVQSSRSAPLPESTIKLPTLRASRESISSTMVPGEGRDPIGTFRTAGTGHHAPSASNVVRGAGENRDGDATTVPAGPASEPDDPRGFLRHRHFEVLTLEQLQDRDSSWHPVGRFRIYLSAQHRYYGLHRPEAALPLWIYEGELAPEFLDEQQAWKFYDHLPVRILRLEALPLAVADHLYQACGLQVPAEPAQEPRHAPSPAVVIVKEEQPGGHSQPQATVSARPAKPPPKRGFLAFLARLFTRQ